VIDFWLAALGRVPQSAACLRPAEAYYTGHLGRISGWLIAVARKSAIRNRKRCWASGRCREFRRQAIDSVRRMGLATCQTTHTWDQGCDSAGLNMKGEHRSGGGTPPSRKQGRATQRSPGHRVFIEKAGGTARQLMVFRESFRSIDGPLFHCRIFKRWAVGEHGAGKPAAPAPWERRFRSEPSGLPFG